MNVVRRLLDEAMGDTSALVLNDAFAALSCLLEEYDFRRDGGVARGSVEYLEQYFDPEVAQYRLSAEDVDCIVNTIRDAVQSPADITPWQVTLLKKAGTPDARDLLLASLAALRGEGAEHQRGMTAAQIVNSFGHPAYQDDERVRAVLRDLRTEMSEAGEEARELLGYLDWLDRDRQQ